MSVPRDNLDALTGLRLGDVSHSTYLSHPMAAVYAMSFALNWALEVPVKRPPRQWPAPRRLAVAAPSGGE